MSPASPSARIAVGARRSPSALWASSHIAIPPAAAPSTLGRNAVPSDSPATKAPVAMTDERHGQPRRRPAQYRIATKIRNGTSPTKVHVRTSQTNRCRW
jgi:hypothetical protein